MVSNGCSEMNVRFFLFSHLFFVYLQCCILDFNVMNKHQILEEIKNDKEFRDELITTLFDITPSVKPIKVPVEERDKDDEENLINLLIDDFDFNITKKVSSVLPALDEEYDYYAGISEFQSVEEMKRVARHTIETALNGLWDGCGYLMCNDRGELIAIEYTVDGQFTVWVQYDVEDKSYFGSLAWNIASSQNY